MQRERPSAMMKFFLARGFRDRNRPPKRNFAAWGAQPRKRSGGLLRGVPCRAAPSAISSGVKTFRAVEHRLEFVARIAGVEFYNDSKATNVDATLKAVEAFPGPLIVILGGKDKGSPYNPLRELLRQRARGVLLIGAAAEKIASDLHGAVPIEHAENWAER